MAAAGFGHIKKVTSSNISGTQKPKEAPPATSTQGAISAQSIAAALNAPAITKTSTQSGSKNGLASSAFAKLGIGDSLPKPGASANSALEGIDLTHPNMNAIMAILTALQTQLSTGAGQNQIGTLKSIDAEIVNRVKEIQREIQEQIDKANSLSGFEKFIHDVCDNDALNKIADGLQEAGPYLSVIFGSIAMGALILCCLVCPLAIFLMPGAIFLFIDGVDQMTGNHIFGLVVDVLAKLLEAMGVESEKAEQIAKVITYVVYMIAMVGAVACSGFNPVTAAPFIMIGSTMGRSGQGFEDTNALIDKEQQIKDKIDELKQELVQLLEKRAIIAKKIGDIIGAELSGKTIQNQSEKDLREEIDQTAKESSLDEQEYKKLVEQTNFETINPDAPIVSPEGNSNPVESPEMMEILLNIMESMGIKFIQLDDGSYSFNPNDFGSGTPGVTGIKVSEGLIDTMSQNDTASLLSAFLSRVLNSPDIFQVVIRNLQNELKTAIANNQAMDHEDTQFRSAEGII